MMGMAIKIMWVWGKTQALDSVSMLFSSIPDGSFRQQHSLLRDYRSGKLHSGTLNLNTTDPQIQIVGAYSWVTNRRLN